MQFIKISWQKYEKDCLFLAKRLRSFKFDTIVVISRGGLVIGRILSDLLTIPISHLTIIAYQDFKQKKTIKITETPNKNFANQTILLVDEIADSGKTFKKAVAYFKKYKNCQIKTAALYIKPQTSFQPDFWQKKVNDWIIFPYEIKETYEAFIRQYKSQTEAKKQMLKLGFKNWQIENII